MLEAVKLSLRIGHDFLDDEINHVIEEARAELVRSGVSLDVAYDDENPLVTSAVKTYCKMILGNDKTMAEGYRESWLYQQDCLRKS